MASSLNGSDLVPVVTADPAPGDPRPPAGVAAGARATVARNALFLVAGQAATTLLAIALSAALGRSLGAADFGTLYLITTMATFAYVVAEWGQPLLVTRQAARDPGRSGTLLGTALALRVASSVAVAITAGLFAWALGYGARTTGLAVLMIACGLPLFLAQGFGMIFRAHDRMGREAVVSVSNKAVLLLVTMAVLRAGGGIPGVVVAQAVAGAAGLAVAVKLHSALRAPPAGPSSSVARELLRGGAPIVAMTAAVWAQPYLDAILLSKLSPAEAVGWYGAARTVLGTLMAPATILAAAAYPRLARAAGDPALLRDELRAALRPLVWLAALAATGTYLFARDVIALIYGGAFSPAARILEFFAPGFFLLFLDILLGHVIYAAGRGHGFAVAKVASVAVATAVNLVLIPLFQRRAGNGGIGVVVSFAVSELVVFAGAAYVLRRTLDRRAVLDVARGVAAAALSVLAWPLLPALGPGAGIPLCVALFTALSAALGLVRSRDLAMLRGLLRRTGP